MGPARVQGETTAYPSLDLPDSYKDDRLVLMARDPHSLFAYWDMSDRTWQRLDSPGTSLLLTLVCLDDPEASLSFEAPRQRSGSYYVHIAAPSRRYRAALAAVRDGGGVVSGWRRRRKDRLLQRRLPSRLANRLISRLTGVPLHDHGCTLKAYERRVFEGFEFYGDIHRILPVYAAMRGFPVREMEVNHRPRRRGRSHYGLGRTWSLLLDILGARFVERSLHRPMHLFGKWGLAAFGLGGLVALFVIVRKILVPEEPWTTPMFFVSVVLVLAGFQLVAVGLLAMLVARVYHHVAGRHTYEVRRGAGRTGALPTTPPEAAPPSRRNGGRQGG